MSKKFTKLTDTLNKELSKKERKSEGIYFTPNKIRERLFDIISPLITKTRCVTFLEPCYGSGEFINDIETKFPNSKITGIEKNEKIFSKTKDKFGQNTTLINCDFLSYDNIDLVDIIIGNPPYYVTTLKNKKCMSGRGNIFVLILYKCLTEHLKDGGIIAFILPTSFYNCSYYEKCRNYIAKHMTILHIENVDGDFFETNQDVMLFVAKKEKSNENQFIVKLNDSLYFSPFYKEIKELIKDSKTLKELGYSVKTGSVVWNENKKNLTDDDSETLLIYSSNIDKNNVLVLNNLLGKEKKQYIKNINKEPIRGSSILINRGYGNKYTFRSTLVEDIPEYYVENHLNVITPITSSQIISINQIKDILDGERVKLFIKYFIGNGSLSKYELENILPISFL